MNSSNHPGAPQAPSASPPISREGDGLVVIVMGVSGSGKSTLGAALAGELSAALFDGDDFHCAANIAKMARGEPLDDADRAGWLDILRQKIDATLAANRRAVLACSALKEAYRQRLGVGLDRVALVYLKAGVELIRARLRARQGHFMKESMVESQFATLEEPTGAIVVDASTPLPRAVAHILAELGTRTLVGGSETKGG